jgi:hypothetical protein
MRPVVAAEAVCRRLPPGEDMILRHAHCQCVSLRNMHDIIHASALAYAVAGGQAESRCVITI